MTKRILPLFAFLLFIACKPQPSEKPNIILIVTDDQGWGDLRVHGNLNIQTPNIDNLSKNGVSFNHFYVSPVCSPTRAELLTGRYHARGGVYSTSAGGERLDLDETVISEIFKEAGYATAAYGKWHNGTQPPYHPVTRGFDDFYGFCSGHWGNYFSPILEHNGEIVDGNGYIIDDLTDHGLEFMEKKKDGSFFLYLPYNTPHSPMQVPDEWWEKYKDKDLSMLHRDPEKENIEFTRAALAMCENIDWNVGRIIDKVERLGLSEETIIIYMSDNGPNSWRWNDGMKGKKGSTDEGGVRSPLFIQWKGKIASNREIQEIAGAIDLLPTLTGLAGIDFIPDKPLDGVNLTPLILAQSNNWQERVIVSSWGERVSIRNQKYRLDNQNRLYDVESDIGQVTDLSEELPEIRASLLQEKKLWMETVYGELENADPRPFTIGDNDLLYTHLPARDAEAGGDIQRSNRFPNCSFFSNWKSIDDSITWDVNVLYEGHYEVELYYTLAAPDTGTVIALTFGDTQLQKKITEPHDPPLTGMGDDRIPRMESYVKDFKSMTMGTIHLPERKGVLSLKAMEIPGNQTIDFRLLVLKSVK